MSELFLGVQRRAQARRALSFDRRRPSRGLLIFDLLLLLALLIMVALA